VSVLHDHPVLGPTEVVEALAHDKAQPQVERIRITPLPMTLEEISKLWTAFQTNYRVSTAYEVDVVIIESDRARRAALPVLRRGAADRGPYAVASASPWLSSAVAPNAQAAVRLGQPLRLEGGQLGQDGLVVRITGSLLTQPAERTPVERSPDHLAVHLPDLASAGAMTSWAPGFYTAAVVVRQPNVPNWTSNEVAFAVAPTITLSQTAAPAGALTIGVTCAPRPRVGQRIELLFGDQQVASGPITFPVDPAQPAEISFDVVGTAGKSYVLRLRVDGVDSIPLGAPGAGPPAFDPQQTVTFA
jgi:Pvc16 N-terminal domain